MPPCSGGDTGGNITRRESGLTSLRCGGTRELEEPIKQGGDANDGGIFCWCCFPHPHGLAFHSMEKGQMSFWAGSSGEPSSKAGREVAQGSSPAALAGPFL